MSDHDASAHPQSAESAYRHLPEPISVADMTTSLEADPPPPLPDSDYDRQERFLRDAGG